MSDPPAGSGVAYLDSSALVKLAVVEPESRALRDTLKRCARSLGNERVVAHVEVPRAVLATGTSRNRARLVLARIATIHLSDSVIAIARSLEPPTLRSLDAIHIASASSLGVDLAALITYDTRMQEAARTVGIAVLAPT